MYSTQNEENSVVPQRVIKTLKNKIYKHMTAVSKNIYSNVLDDIVDKCNNKYHRIIKLKPIDVRSDSFADYNEESNAKYPKFKIIDNVRILKYEPIFAKGYILNWSEEVSVINTTEKTVQWTYAISDLNGEEIGGSFYEK